MEPQPYDVVERTVKSRGKAGQVYLPKDWTGKRVRILLLDPLDFEEEEETPAERIY